MSGLADRGRLAQLIAQLDQEGPTREIAFRRVHEHLKRNGQKFVDLANAVREPEPAPQPKAAAAPAQHDDGLRGPFIHEPRAPSRFWSYAKEVDGKRIIRGHKPPPGSKVRLRVLSQDEAYGFIKFKCSGETKHEIYEPFDLHAASGSEDHETIVRCSCNGVTLVF